MAKTKAKPEKNKNNKFYKQTKKQTNKQNKEEENTDTKNNGPQDSLQKKKLITRTPLHIGVNRKKDNTCSKYDDRSLVFSCTRIIYLSGLGCTNLN